MYCLSLHTQDMKGCLTPAEVCEGLGLQELHNHKLHVQKVTAIRGEGLHAGLDWLARTIKASRS
jgi:Arf/Sar family protein